MDHDLQVLKEIHEHFDHVEARLSAVEGLDVRVKALESILMDIEAKLVVSINPDVQEATKELDAADVRFFMDHSRTFSADWVPEMNDMSAGDSSTADSSSKLQVTSDMQLSKPSENLRVSRRISMPVVDCVDEKILDVQTQEYYRFGESTWDLVLFIGTGALGPLGSLQTFLLALSSVAMQIVFTGIAWYNFLQPEVDDTTIRDAFRWRRSAGHALSQYDPLSKSSLAERVCALDMSLPASGIQMSLYENIVRYVKPSAEGFESFFTGERLCLVALICWYLMVAKEVNHGLALHRGIIATPLGTTRINSRENPFTLVTHYRLIAVSRWRKAASGLLLAYRLLAAAALLYVGTFFLVYTINVTELILNAVALAIILDIDDLLFDALATTPGRHLVNQMDPLPMKPLPRLRGADLKSTCMLVLIPLATAFVYANMLAPMVTTLVSAQEALCGGNLKFVWTTDARSVVLFSPTQGDGWNDPGLELQFKAIDEAEILLEREESSWGVWLDGMDDLAETSTLDVEQAVDLSNPRCGDLADREPLRNYLRSFLGNQSVMGCLDAKPYCDLLDGSKGKGFAARMLCSDTCGCNEPAGEFMKTQGCPYGLGRPCWSSEAFLRNLRGSSCEEKSAEELRSDASWSQWVQSVRAVGESEATREGKAEALVLADAMWEHGCSFGDKLTEMNVTWGTCFSWRFDWGLKTMEGFCPTSCGCDATKDDSSACPRPLGRNCETISECIFADRYYCPDETSILVGKAELKLNDAVFQLYSAQVAFALQASLANITGHGVRPRHVQVAERLPSSSSRRLVARRLNLVKMEYSYTVFLTAPGVDETAAREALKAPTEREASDAFIHHLLEAGLPADQTADAALDIKVNSAPGSSNGPSPPTSNMSTTSTTPGPSHEGAK